MFIHTYIVYQNLSNRVTSITMLQAKTIFFITLNTTRCIYTPTYAPSTFHTQWETTIYLYKWLIFQQKLIFDNFSFMNF